MTVYIFYLLKVCPTFSAPLIKRVFNNFVPDEFCPEPFPDSVIDALDSEVGICLEKKLRLLV